MSKKCRRCKELKELSEFDKCLGTSDGLQYECHACIKARWRKRIEREEKKEDTPDSIKRYLIRTARARAKEKGLPCTIKPSDIELVSTCPVLQVELRRNRGTYSPNSYSLDRRDNGLGYIPGNVRVVSWKLNSLKAELTLAQAERLVEYMKGNL